MGEKLEDIELQEFVKNVLNQIESGADIGNRGFDGAIEFEISIAKTQKLDGNIKIYVAQGGGEISKESVAKIKFQIYPKYPKKNNDNFPKENNWNI